VTADATASGEVLVSVVTVARNAQALIGRTLDSVLAQTGVDIEYIVVDGASTDATPMLVAERGARIDIFVHEPDRGIYDAMNKAIDRASGDFLIFLNAGDVFANSAALASAAVQIEPGVEQALFGRWIRRSARSDRVCSASLAQGRFNHQAVLYSRSIHDWHGRYACVNGLTTADYLFFATLLGDGRVRCRTVDTVIAAIDVGGVSAGLQTFAQKSAADYLCGRIGRARLVAYVLLHPVYAALKKLIVGAR
jgi:glycosyltransferase involved in cell wall biosynthesis